MSVAVSGGHPQYGTDGSTGLVPELFASEFNIEYWATTLLPQITTGKFYEGLLQQGDKVTIPTEPTITITDYSKGAELDIEVPTSTPITMTVDRAKYFNIALDSIDEKQSHLKLASKYVEVAMRQMKQDIETQFLADIFGSAHASNQGLTAGAISSSFDLGTLADPQQLTTSTVVDVVTRVRAVLAEQNAFMPGKVWMIIPEWARYTLVNSELRQAYLTGDSKSVLRSGLLGEIDGINIYTSNLLPSANNGSNDVFYCMAGNMDAISYIAQLSMSEKMRSEKTFATLFRSLMVYDWKVRKPEGLVTIAAYK